MFTLASPPVFPSLLYSFINIYIWRAFIEDCAEYGESTYKVFGKVSKKKFPMCVCVGSGGKMYKFVRNQDIVQYCWGLQFNVSVMVRENHEHEMRLKSKILIIFVCQYKEFGFEIRRDHPSTKNTMVWLREKMGEKNTGISRFFLKSFYGWSQLY